MYTSIYDRIPQIPTDQLTKLVKLWTIATSQRPTPRRHDYWGRCLNRAILTLEQRALIKTLPVTPAPRHVADKPPKTG